MSLPTDPVSGLSWLRESDRSRAEHSALRDRMLSGLYWDDLEKAITTHLPALRRQAWGPMDMTSNVFRSISGEIGPVPYDSEPHLDGPAGSEQLITRSQGGILTDCGYWPLMQSTGEQIVGLREVVMRLEHSDVGGLSADPVPPHRVEVDVLSSAPRRPVRMAIADNRDRPDKDAAQEWTWEQWDITDPMAPSYKILSADRMHDLTERYATVDGKAATSAMLSGENWPDRWRWHQGARKGRPFIPCSTYHALTKASYWDAWYGIEAVAGSLTMGVLNTFWIHCVRDGSVATLILVGGVPVGVKVENADGTPLAWVAIEPGAFNMVQPMTGYEGTVTVERMAASADPLMLIQAIQRFEQRVALYAGVSAADLIRESGDPRSGYALSVSNEGKRASAARLIPQLRRSDLESVELSAAIVNGATGSEIPETGYSIGYQGVPLSAGELKARADYVREMLSLGLITRADAVLQFHPEFTQAQIVKYLATADAERSLRASIT